MLACRRSSVLAIVLSSLSAGPLLAQEERQEPPQEEQVAQAQDSIANQQARNCDLTWRPTSNETTGTRVREMGEAFTIYVSGGMIWTCGTATMEADSAVKYDLAGRVELFGNVKYRDSIRTLDSETLTYFEIADLIVAEGDVHLRRLSSGSTLDGPRIQFLRAVTGVDQATIATGRPHMVLYPSEDGTGTPFEVDADSTVFVGEQEARVFGNVDVARPDLKAGADSAYLQMDDGSGVMYGEPWLEGEDFDLSGDTIRIAFDEGSLQSVNSIGHAEAAGESFEVLSEEILVHVEDEDVSDVWAFGAGRSMALSGDQRLYGDSLRFVMTASELDSIISVGRAAAVQVQQGETMDLPLLPLDSLAREPEARADSSATIGPGAPPDSAAAAEEPEMPPDSAAAAADPGPPPAQADRIPEPRLEVSDQANWVAGDTLYAIFERPEDPAVADSTAPAVPVSVTDSIAESITSVAPADSTSDAKLERIRVAGNARSFYATIRDTISTSRASRNYLLGSAIEVVFKDGEPERVFGEMAIGVYLDPMEASAGMLDPGASAAPEREVPDLPVTPPPGGPPVVSDSTAADSVSVPPSPADTVRADSVTADSTRRATAGTSNDAVAAPVATAHNPSSKAGAEEKLARGVIRGRRRDRGRVKGRQ